MILLDLLLTVVLLLAVIYLGNIPSSVYKQQNSDIVLKILMIFSTHHLS